MQILGAYGVCHETQISIAGGDAAGPQPNFGKQGCRRLQLPHIEVI